MAEDEQGMVAKPDNKIFFKCYPKDDKMAHYFRILDFTMLFTPDELVDMKRFFSKVNVEHDMVQCIGVMDDKYIYPKYIGVGYFEDVIWYMDQEKIIREQWLV